MEKLNYSFYNRTDVLAIARDLLGKVLVTKFNGITTAGRIVETEAYAGVQDRASHAYGGRRTARTEAMFGKGGTAYVYLIYGIHSDQQERCAPRCTGKGHRAAYRHRAYAGTLR